MKTLLSLFVCIPFLVCGQGIKFEDGKTWNQIIQKAKAENKFIFIDCYATWCGPCKYMSNKIFPQKNVGDFFNAHFINVAIQMDRTAKDSRSVQAWYKDADSIKKAYAIGSYPTYLFFSPAGKVVHRLIGATGDEKEFISIAANALDSNKQYYTLMAHWKDHLGDSAFLRNAINSSTIADDKITANEIGDHYIDCLKNPFSRENIETYYPLVYSSNQKGFRILLTNPSIIDSVMEDKSYAEWKVGSILGTEKINPLFEKQGVRPLKWQSSLTSIKSLYPQLNDGMVKYLKSAFVMNVQHQLKLLIYNDSTSQIDWTKISENIKEKYPDYDAGQMIAEEKPLYYERKAMWRECALSAGDLMRDYGTKLSPRDIDNISWDYVFTHSDDSVLLRSALEWMKKVVDARPDQENNLDTYANLLYKNGYRTEAIDCEMKAIEAGLKNNAVPDDLKEFRDNLKKMQDGIKTWDDDTAVNFH